MKCTPSARVDNFSIRTQTGACPSIPCRFGLVQRRAQIRAQTRDWPLHDISIANIVWYILQSRGGRRETIYCAIVWVMKEGAGGGGVGGGAQTKGAFANSSVDSCTKASN